MAGQTAIIRFSRKAASINENQFLEQRHKRMSSQYPILADQSQAWGFYAQDHVTKVIRRIHHFNHQVLQYS